MKNPLKRWHEKQHVGDDFRMSSLNDTPISLLPDGRYEATILEIEVRKSRMSTRKYWQFVFGEIEGYPRNRLWWNQLVHIPTDVDRMLVERGQDPCWDVFIPDSVLNSIYTALIGRRVVVSVTTSKFMDNTCNAINRVKLK